MSEVDVVLVDSNDKSIGRMGKQEAHEKGLLHRAVTVYVLNTAGEILLQRRAADKYHCGGLWSNTCCGHPMPNEAVQAAAERRLAEEMGLKLTLQPMFEISYCLSVTNNLTEHEYGHVFCAISDQLPQLNPEEADQYRYCSHSQLQHELADYPENFTPWFRLTYPTIPQYLNTFLAERLAQDGVALR